MTTFECYVCENTYPIIMLESHHVRPQAARGREGPEVPLCIECHSVSHIVAHDLMFPKGNADVVLNTCYSEDSQRQRCVLLAQEIYKAMLEKREGNPDYQPETGTLSATVSLEVKSRFQMLAKESRMSMESLLVSLILSTIIERYGPLE